MKVRLRTYDDALRFRACGVNLELQKPETVNPGIAKPFPVAQNTMT